MSTLSQFTGAGGSMPVGSIIQAPFTLTDPAWKRCDGSKVSRSLYPLLAAQLPDIGTFIGTDRVRPALPSSVPSSGAVANNGTLWALSAAAGVNAIQTTPDGINYTLRTTPSVDVRALLHDGTNFIAVNGNGLPLYSPDGVTWNTSSGGSAVSATFPQTCLTYAPTLGVSGRLCYARSTATVYTSDDHGATWVSREVGVTEIYHVTWTGSKFIGTTSNLGQVAVSTDGITWTTQNLPKMSYYGGPGTMMIISDGAGRVLITNLGSIYSYMLLSQDHGATWTTKTLVSPGVNTVVTGHVPSFTNGRFFVYFNYGWAVSTNLIDWAIVGDKSLIGGTVDSVSYMNGLYLVPNSGSAIAKTFVENTAEMYMPASMVTGNATNNSSASNADFYIKVK